MNEQTSRPVPVMSKNNAIAIGEIESKNALIFERSETNLQSPVDTPLIKLNLGTI